jgi:hypothetical protein
MNARQLRSMWVAAATLALAVLAVPEARAQGCVASRLDAPACSVRNDDQLESYNLHKGSWESSFGYRFFRSHRHFVGSVEQDGGPGSESDRRNSEVVNHVHIPTLSVSYGVSDRLSVSANLPSLIAHRSSPPSASRPFRQHTDARGVSDVVLMGRYWLGTPSHHASQNFSVGVGVKLPTGNDGAEDDVWVNNSATRVLELVSRPVDQSIQPGDGGFGLMTEVQGFKAVGSVALFASGSDLFNPKATNGVPTNRSRAADAFMSVADQYAARVGVATASPFLSRRIGLSLAARLEGVPSEDLLGSSDGFRRPGYSVGIEPGLSYGWKGNSVSLSVPYLVRRVRTQSVSDKQATVASGRHVQGDAAFADFVVIFGYSRRF